MTRRRAVLVGGVVVALLVAAVSVWSYRAAHRAPAGCDTVHSLIAYNTQFAEQMKSAAGTDKAGAVTPDQYREWAARVQDYAGRISNPELAGKANTAADLAGRLADLVPRYRAKPDDAAAASDYTGLGIEYGNAINRLEYACLPVG
jgi:hypothetical protein